MFIYIMRDSGNSELYKIGISKEPKKRRCQLQTGNPHLIKLIFEMKIEDDINPLHVEKIVHNYLKEKNIWMLGEWFHIKEEDMVVRIANAMLSIKKN